MCTKNTGTKTLKAWGMGMRGRKTVIVGFRYLPTFIL
jgi:hypothetical protein